LNHTVGILNAGSGASPVTRVKQFESVQHRYWFRSVAVELRHWAGDISRLAGRRSSLDASDRISSCRTSVDAA